MKRLIRLCVTTAVAALAVALPLGASAAATAAPLCSGNGCVQVAPADTP
ncbi:hypothetical protein ACIQ6Y_21820 [Streptomyces sp. NPDC096205]